MSRRDQGYTLIELLIVIAVIGILSAIAIPNLFSTRKTANEASAISCLRLIHQAEAGYRGRHNSYGTLSNLASDYLIDPALGAASGAGSTKSGFYFIITPVNETEFFVDAVPTSPGDRQFYTDEVGVLFYGPSNPGVIPSADSHGDAPSGFTTLNN